ncbi:Nuclear pore complex protein Nup98-Nup96 [Cleaved into: Nuclear pore complex protein Nup98 (Nucleoporin Nup98) [Durusdinium trenchii]|uniref:Nuclear pore complex protein Nup98-Nup96 [Cleaved into: Nuclear pore complex protein Nup98 (Nucleoporin Nup98) n=1 Tax=Durusdinium trenchii TaxID=1381693 RepID=A0ABP0JVH4_9DINO
MPSSEVHGAFVTHTERLIAAPSVSASVAPSTAEPGTTPLPSDRADRVEEAAAAPGEAEPGFVVEPELSQLSSSQLKSVQELKVLKPGVGMVVFHGTTDCTDLDVARDIVLKRGYVLVYPDQKKKPPPGHGLNKHATVTMYQCFPPGEPLRALSEEAVAEYKDKIRRMTEENSACTFIDYDCQTGVWKFEVEPLVADATAHAHAFSARFTGATAAVHAQTCQRPSSEQDGVNSAKSIAANELLQSEKRLAERKAQLRHETFRAVQAAAPRPGSVPLESSYVPPEETEELPAVSASIPTIPPVRLLKAPAEPEPEEVVAGPAPQVEEVAGTAAAAPPEGVFQSSEQSNLSAVLKIIEAVAVLLGDTDGQILGICECEVNVQEVLTDSLPQKLASFDPGSITASQRSKVKSLLKLPDVQPDAASICHHCASLSQWCECVMAFLRADLAEEEARSAARRSARRSEKQDRLFAHIQVIQVFGKSDSSLRPQLVTFPDLSQLSAAELKSVRELTVSRPDVGSVIFHGLTDCSDLQVERDIVLQKGFILVYPDPVKKPQPGCGLNKPATVTMYNCFPPGELLMEDPLVREDYKEKIRLMTEENRTCKFLDYDCQRGIWQFEVNRF